MMSACSIYSMYISIRNYITQANLPWMNYAPTFHPNQWQHRSSLHHSLHHLGAAVLLGPEEKQIVYELKLIYGKCCPILKKKEVINICNSYNLKVITLKIRNYHLKILCKAYCSLCVCISCHLDFVFRWGVKWSLDATAAATLIEHVSITIPCFILQQAVRLLFVNVILILKTSWQEHTSCL